MKWFAVLFTALESLVHTKRHPIFKKCNSFSLLQRPERSQPQADLSQPHHPGPLRPHERPLPIGEWTHMKSRIRALLAAPRSRRSRSLQTSFFNQGRARKHELQLRNNSVLKVKIGELQLVYAHWSCRFPALTPTKRTVVYSVCLSHLTSSTPPQHNPLHN